VGRQYAGILGAIAFTTVVLQGLGHDAEVESTLRSAVISTGLFAAIGYAVGEVAGWIVLDSVRARWADELDGHRIATHGSRSIGS